MLFRSGGNINRLKAGYVLRLPDIDEVASRDLGEAQAEVVAQNQAWREGRDSGPIPEPARPQLDATADGSELVATTDDASEDGILEIATADDGGESLAGDDLSDELIASYEDIDRTRRDLLDLQARLSELEERNRTLERLNELKDDQLKALQDELGRTQLADADVTAEPEEATPEGNQVAPSGPAEQAASSDPPPTY